LLFIKLGKRGEKYSKILVKKFGTGEKSVTFAPAIKATFI
jgi:hypothetical protein